MYLMFASNKIIHDIITGETITIYDEIRANAV